VAMISPETSHPGRNTSKSVFQPLTAFWGEQGSHQIHKHDNSRKTVGRTSCHDKSGDKSSREKYQQVRFPAPDGVLG
ncbi:hypothetical protein CQA18_27600, partial [Enterobacter hormaechei]